MKYFLPVIILVALLAGGWLMLKPAPEVVPEGPPALGDDWVRSAPSAQGLTFEYPDPLAGTYFSASEWPPLVEKVANAYSCRLMEDGTDGPVPVKGERVIDGKTYCISVTGEGAAGSTYRTYEYSTDRGDGVFRAVFTIRFPQCLNYDEPKSSECAADQASFDPDALAVRLISSARMQ
jgi:hypothetical protein